MNILRKAICIILSVMLLFGVLPLTSSAGKTVEEVFIFNYEYPIIGITPSDMPKLDVPEDADYILDDFCWCLDSTKEEFGMDEPFEEGIKYCLKIRLLPAEDCAFSQYVSINVSGEVDQGEFLVRPYEIVIYTPAVTPFADRISEVVIENFKSPEPGQDFNTLTWPTAPEGAHYTVVSYWVDDISGDYVWDGDTFISGSVYTLYSCVTPKEGYCFDTDVKYAITGDDITIDEEASIIKRDYMELVSKPIYLIAEGTEFITNIDVSGVSVPMAGQTCADNLLAITVSDQCVIDYCGWVDTSCDYMMEPDDVFNPGVVYYMYFNLSAAEGYAFDPFSLPEITINGDTELLDADYTSLDFDEGHAMIAFFSVDIIPLPNPDLTTVTEVDLTGFSVPTVGQTAAENLASVTVSDNCTLLETGWVNVETDTFLSDDEIFVQDNLYYLCAVVTPADGFIFDPDHLPDVYINGEKTLVDDGTNFFYYDSGRQVFAFYTLDITPEAAPEILYGDCNGDGEITGKDLIRLRKYLNGENVEIFPGADCSGDGEITGKDLIRLRKYLSGESVTLGPQR